MAPVEQTEIEDLLANEERVLPETDFQEDLNVDRVDKLAEEVKVLTESMATLTNGVAAIIQNNKELLERQSKQAPSNGNGPDPMAVFNQMIDGVGKLTKIVQTQSKESYELGMQNGSQTTEIENAQERNDDLAERLEGMQEQLAIAKETKSIDKIKDVLEQLDPLIKGGVAALNGKLGIAGAPSA